MAATNRDNYEEFTMPDGNAPAEAGKMSSASKLLHELSDELIKAAFNIDQADSLTNTAAFALRRQDCDVDHDVADVLQHHTYPTLRSARDAIANAEELVARLQDVTRGLSALASLIGEADHG